MEILSKDNLFSIGLNLDSQSLLTFYKTYKKFYETVCKKDYFWKLKIEKDYPLLVFENKEEISWKFFYIEMIYYIAILEKEYGIPYIPTKNYNPKKFYKNPNKKYFFNQAMADAALGGHRDIVDLMIEKGAEDFEFSMCAASLGGHMDLVKCMIGKGVNEFGWALGYAAKGGHIDIVKLFMERGVSELHRFDALTKAIKKNHLDIVKYFIKYTDFRDIEIALGVAKKVEHSPIIKYLSDILKYRV